MITNNYSILLEIYFQKSIDDDTDRTIENEKELDEFEVDKRKKKVTR